MWNQILFDPWDHIFREMRGTPEHYGLDDVTWHFIDAVGVGRNLADNSY